MKKISILLCAAMLLSLLAGCGGGDDLTGTWEAELDVSKTIGDSIATSMSEKMPDLNEYLDFSGLTLIVRTTFNEDGTYVSKVTDESMNAMLELAAKKAADGLTKYMTELIEQYKMDVDINAVFGLAEGETLEEKIKAEFQSEDFKKSIASDYLEGVYKAEDGKLFTADKAENFSDTKYETYELDGDELVLTGSEGMEENVNSIMNKVYPMTYKKIG